MKESKSIPNLIFSIEQYERFLIQLSKKTKVRVIYICGFLPFVIIWGASRYQEWDILET